MSEQDLVRAPEEWRDCPSFPGFRASSLGRVLYPSGRSAKPALDRDGYARVQWTDRDDVRRTTFQHAIVADAFLGPRPVGHDVDHIDGVRSNNWPSNLRYLTHDQNVKASAAAGRTMRGERHVSAVLTEEQARAILAEYTRPPRVGRKKGVIREGGVLALAAKYGISYKNIFRLITGETWPHLTAEREAMRLRVGLSTARESNTSNQQTSSPAASAAGAGEEQHRD